MTNHASRSRDGLSDRVNIVKRLLQGLCLRPVCVLGSCQVRPPKRGMSRTRRLVATGCFQGCCMSFQNKWPRKQLGGRQNGYGSFFDQQSTICVGAQRASEHFITTNTLSSHVTCRSVIFIVIFIFLLILIIIFIFVFILMLPLIFILISIFIFICIFIFIFNTKRKASSGNFRWVWGQVKKKLQSKLSFAHFCVLP